MPDTPTVVVVDDAPEVRVLVRTRLRVSGRFEVVGEGADGEQAVELAARLRPTVLLLDVSMPRTDGLAALPRVLAASPGTRVVMFSGFEEGALVDRALELGAAAFVEKSAPVDLLVGGSSPWSGRSRPGATSSSSATARPSGCAPTGSRTAASSTTTSSGSVRCSTRRRSGWRR